MTGTERWTFQVPTPLGMTESTYELTAEGLRFTSDDPMQRSELLPWATIRQGCTAAMAGMGGRGMPDMANWVPAQMEWLLFSRTAGGGEAFMRLLPQGSDRESVVSAVQQRLGGAWVGSRLPLKEAQSTLGISESTSGTLKVYGLVVTVMLCLVGLIFVLGVLVHPLVFTPIGFLVGGWICSSGLTGLRDAIALANTPTARTSSAAVGFVELEGRAVTDDPSPAGITGRPSVWWDVSVYLWYIDGDRDGSWRQVKARYGGDRNLIQLEDASGRLPIWTEDATMVLSCRTWESDKDELPAAGLALLDDMGFPWSSGKQMRVVEQCLEVNGTLYVLGTLEERRRIIAFGQQRGLNRWRYLLRSGEWRRVVVAAVPAKPEMARMVTAVLIAYLDMVTSIGRGGERPSQSSVKGDPPPMKPDALLVWKGQHGRPFVVSNQAEASVLADLRRRSLVTFVFGGAILCFTLYQFLDYFGGK